MVLMRRFLLLTLIAATAAASEIDPTAFAAQLRAGEAIDGFPSWGERVIHEWINRARVDPQADLAGCGAGCAERACYTAVPPLSWSEQLNRSARFHASEIARQQYFTHDSHCTVVPNIAALYPVGCDGSASCACVGGTSSCGPGGCTTWPQRIGLFGGAAAGEIIASPGDPNGAFYLWLYESSSSATCAFSAQNGHRWLILQSSGSVGIGMDGVSVGDFSNGGTPYKIPSGSHYPQQAPSVELWANWYDSAAPRSANAVVDGHCISMNLRRGTTQNGAWSTTAAGVGSGCHRYYFSFVDASGIEVTYPATGSLGIGSGGACADWDVTRLHASCNASNVPSRHRASRH
jgi:hypothetical protein